MFLWSIWWQDEYNVDECDDDDDDIDDEDDDEDDDDIDDDDDDHDIDDDHDDLLANACIKLWSVSTQKPSS